MSTGTNDEKIGRLLQAVETIEENTKSLPHIAAMIEIHDAAIKDMKPKVEEHERASQRAIGVAAVFGALSGILTVIVKGIIDNVSTWHSS